MKILQQPDMKTPITAETGDSTTDSSLTTTKLTGARIMGDSESSRILSTNACRNNLLSAVTGFLANPTAKISQSLIQGPDSSTSDDTILEAWESWYAARMLQDKLCRRQQRLERKLMQMAGGFPHVELTVPGRSAPVFARTAEETDRWLPGVEMEGLRDRAKSELARARNAWDTADAKLGYSAAHAAENKAGARAIDLAATLLKMPARSIEDLTAKLHCLIEMEDPGAMGAETPWLELRSILLDLLELNGR
ncbi:hypothetical protein PY650_20765 [Rhizobium calliandrae]|uniref:Uncharacterized protein n=1 Tax=Rhizobium calliandrae TaxID=1312182 RepID=A0ABT7KJ78_9HYPH|nr:hypothetical protein [Rhizobium calliandrae]MDL2408050.1 hypothetical protein [Rhizobium calliandrae]